MTELLKVLEAHQIHITPDFTGTMIRNGALWFIGKTITTASGQVYQCANFGDWSRDLDLVWNSGESGQTFSPEELDEISKQLELIAEERRKDKLKNQEATAEKSRHVLDSLPDTTNSTPYLDRKKISKFGAKIQGQDVLVPLRDVDGTVWNFQRILPDGSKRFQKGGRIDELYFLLQDNPDTNSPAYIVEGFATAASVAMALGQSCTVIVAFNSQNIPKVAKAIRGLWPKRRLVIAADNDCWKDASKNPGLEAATIAAHKSDCEVRYPVFNEEFSDQHPTDFNDLARLTSLEEVKRQLETAQTKTPASTEKSKKLSDFQAAQELARRFGDTLLKYGEKDFFLFGGKYWEHLVTGENDYLFREMAKVLGPKAKTSDVHSAVTYFSKHCQKPPRGLDMLQQNFYKANFQNGTLHANKMNGKFYLEFRAHNQFDYLTSMLPFEFPLPYGSVDKESLAKLAPTDGPFKDFLDGLYKGDVDAKDKVQAIAELFGCALMPAYSRIFFMVGKPASGKSTVVKLLTKVVGDQNVSRVAPSDLIGFNLAATVGKRLNIDLDVSTRKPIEEDTLKKIVDRAKYRIQRKFLPDLEAPLPPVHAFCCNDLPKTLEGATEAFNRRVIIIRFGQMEKTGTDFTWDYEEILWEKDQLAVIRFAVLGMIGLMMNGGHFTVPESSKGEIKVWMKENDLAEQFLEDLRKGMFDTAENKFVVHPQAKLDRRELSEMWVKYVRDHNGRMGRNVMIKRLRANGFDEAKIEGEWFFTGLGIVAQESSIV